MENISINNGYFATKVKTSTKEFKFESKVKKALDKYESNFVLNGELYSVGTGSNALELDKTDSFTQEACISYAIQSATKDRDIRVISAMHYNAYSNKKAREQYKEWLLDIDRVKECEVYPEGAAAVLNDLGWYNNKLVCLVDIGGLTANIMLFDNGKLVPDTAFSCELGTIILENKIRIALQQSELVNVPEYQLKYLKDNEVVKAVLEGYAEDIKQEMRKMSYPSKLEFRFTGGGALKYRELFEKHFNAYISNSAVWENVRGLYLLSEVIWNEN